WATSSQFCAPSNKLLCDNTGNVFYYSSQTHYRKGDTLNYNTPHLKGSFIQKYSSNGTLLLMKEWPGNIFIKQIICTDNSNFYFTGGFSGDTVFEGHTIFSEGEMDGFVGKMDGEGKVIWISTFGGGGND